VRLPFVRSRPKYLAVTEYWLFMPKAKLPPQAAYMNRMVKVHPLKPGSESPIGHREALMFSDIRLHIALVLRAKNPHVFRPDLFDDAIVPTPEVLSRLGESESFAKCQYVSTYELGDDRSLTFMPYLVESIAGLTRGSVVFDVSAHRLQTIEEFRSALLADERATGFDTHVRTFWRRLEEGGRVETKGLIKKGLCEIETPETSSDHRVLLEAVIEAAARQIWETHAQPDQLEVEAFGDRFIVSLAYKRKPPVIARVHRIHA